MVLAITLRLDWAIRQMDGQNAFLHRILNEENYMNQPQGFVDLERPNYVCRLHKSLYGLKQSSRGWFHCLSQYLLGLGFKESFADSSLFIMVN